uniref:NADH-ubiquinone oxidoreductase chain 3 n=1 Tax=Cacopsylla coccinea TaxID=1646117 RepID=A0A0U2A0N9_CACCO|nr:NADH dehydrogenase subunit 3 [Cacopsylla coccinea]AKE49761.1 NADH dehydrogenase subunit 3 [Cacopsylla coccinea]
MIMMTLIFISTIMTMMMMAISIIPLINLHKKLDREKSSPFECGFDPFSKPRVSFSIHFLSISLMFLIFDIEITLVLPTPILMKEINILNWVISCFFLFTILMLGLVLEWKQGSMNWM